MEDLVFEPLEMRRSTFDPTVAMTYPLAQSHDLVEDADRGAHLRVQHKYADNVGHYPAGFAISNVLDMANWMTIARTRKQQAQDYAFCLDAWLAGASFEAPARELTALGYRQIDWRATCAALWQTLGERTEAKELLVERMLHSLCWSIKFTFWDDDPASAFGRDQYLGDYARVDDVAGAAGIDGYYERPTFCYEQASPRIQRVEARLAELLPDWAVWRGQLIEWWLCAPKSFRFLERILWAIGQGRPLQPGDAVPSFLHCEDTYPDQDQAARWWAAFSAALDGWWRGQSADSEVAADVHERLGPPTPVKRWLVRLFSYKLVCLEENGAQLANLVRADHNHRRGTKPI